MANSDHPDHPVLAREMYAYLRWRNANNRQPDVVAAQRRDRARGYVANTTTGWAVLNPWHHDQPGDRWWSPR